MPVEINLNEEMNLVSVWSSATQTDQRRSASLESVPHRQARGEPVSASLEYVPLRNAREGVPVFSSLEYVPLRQAREGSPKYLAPDDLKSLRK